MDAAQELIPRELSWLEFNQRVLDEALSPEVPLLERLKFLAITCSNLDEFYMVRVGGLHLLIEEGARRADPGDLAPRHHLEAITRRVRRMTASQYACYRRLQPALAETGLRALTAPEWDPGHTAWLQDYVRAKLASLVTPAAITEDGVPPLLQPLKLYLAVRFESEGAGQETGGIALLPLHGPFPRWIRLRGEGFPYVPVEAAVEHFINAFFPGRPIAECAVFRITRNADIAVREDLAPDLLTGMQEVLSARRDSPCIRLEIERRASALLRRRLIRHLHVPPEGVYRVPGPLDLAAFMDLAVLEGFDAWRYPPWPPQPPPEFDPSGSLFEMVAQRDLLLVHPYESFDPVVKLVEEAADDPEVLAIKQILYRVSRDSPLVGALQRAAENGKAVTVLVELKARFDEALNIERARALERAGANVIYGVKGLKTHAKVCIVVREESRGIRRYLHFGTGNYNEKTARLYSDVSLLTADEALGADASAFFNAVCGHSQPAPFIKLEAAPQHLRERLLGLIEDTIACRQRGEDARILAKMNSLVDPALIRALYRASRAGVRILLNVRGICRLRPETADLSENIRVVSIVDRYLEHARIYGFRHGAERQIFLSSADWMPRNLDRRIELLVPVEDPACARRLWDVLEAYFRDTVKARWILPDGSYRKPRPGRGRARFRVQEALYREACRARETAIRMQRTVFEPHLPPEGGLP